MEQSIQKPISFEDVEKEFNYVKPLSEKSRALILKKFVTVQNYRDSIYVKRLKGNRGYIINATKINTNSSYKVIKLKNDDLKRIKIIKDSINSDRIDTNVDSGLVIKNKIVANNQSNVLVQIDDDYGNLYVFSMSPDDYILDEAEAFGAYLPSSCRAGACASCCSKVISGIVYCPDQSYYDEDQTEEGYFAMCVAYPWSNCSVLANQEEFLYCK